MAFYLPMEPVLLLLYLSNCLINRWRGFNFRYKPRDMVHVERKRLDKVHFANKLTLEDFSDSGYLNETTSCPFDIIPKTLQERTLEEHQKMVEKIMKRDEIRRKRIAAAGIDYECPEIVRELSELFYLLDLVTRLVLFLFDSESPSKLTCVFTSSGG